MHHIQGDCDTRPGRISAGIDDCKTAMLRYRIGSEAEQSVTLDRYPWEFSVKTTDLQAPITWKVDVQLADGRKVCAQ